MKACLAVTKQTILSLIRNGAFPYVAILTLILVALISINVTSGAEEVQSRAILETSQIIFGYAGNILIFCTTLGVLWSSCFSLSQEIDKYNIHLVVVKPCSFVSLWVGKLLGIFTSYAAILLLGYALIYGIFFFRTKNYSQETKDLLQHELLVGRKIYHPDVPDFNQLAEQDYQNKIKNNEIPLSIPKYEAIEVIKRQYSNVEIPPQKIQEWTFSGFPPSTEEINQKVLSNELSNQKHTLKFRLYKNEISSSRSRDEVTAVWQIYRIYKNKEGRENILAMPPETRQVMTDSYIEVPFPVEMIDHNGQVHLRIANPSSTDKLLLIRRDSPKIYSRSINFTNNFLRVFCQSLICLLFVSALGTTLSACFSSPVAIFISNSYLFISLMASGIFQADTGEIALSSWSFIIYPIQIIFISLKDLNAFNYLVHGIELPWSTLIFSFISQIIIRGGLITLLGIYVLSRREYAGQMRK